MARTVLGEVARWDPPPEQEQFYKNFINILDECYPQDWRSWEVNVASYEDLFGDKISSDDENRLRFAIPTVHLANAYSTLSSLSERKYKLIKRILLNWPLGRALIYSPLATMKKIHPSDAYSGFIQNLSDIKSQLLSRQTASATLKTRAEAPTTSAGPSSPSVASSACTPRNARKRSHSPELFQATVAKGLETYMDQQNRLLEQLVAMSKHQTDLLSHNMANHPHSHSPDGQDIEEEETDWVAPAIIELDPAESQPIEQEDFFDFAPDTKESECKLGIAEEALVKQGAHCLRLGEASWQNIRYSDVQKQFQAAPVFTSLKVNSVLATVTPNWQTVTLLDKMDACLGAIIYGILQQRKHFQNIYKAASLEIKTHLSKNFLATDSEFRRTSDSLLQYICGRRSELIQQRRSVYKPINKTLNELLHAIPPSNTHLFAEPQLGDLIKEQGGIHKFFPVRKHQTTVNKPKLFNKTATNQERNQNYKRFNDRRPNYRAPAPGQTKKVPHNTGSTFGNKKPRYDGKPKPYRN